MVNYLDRIFNIVRKPTYGDGTQFLAMLAEDLRFGDLGIDERIATQRPDGGWEIKTRDGSVVACPGDLLLLTGYNLNRTPQLEVLHRNSDAWRKYNVVTDSGVIFGPLEVLLP